MSTDPLPDSTSPTGGPALRGLAITAAVAIALAIALPIWLGGNWIQADASQYLSVARNIAGGHGIATSVIYYDEHYFLGTVPVAQTVFPPGYPALVALVAQIGASFPAAAIAIGLACFALTAVLVCEIAVRSGLGTLGAAVLSASWLACVPAWFLALGCVTDVPFAFLTLLAARPLVRGGEPSVRRAALAGTFAAAAFLVRYAGAFFVLAAAIYFAIEWLRTRKASWIKAAVAFGVPPALVGGAIFARNVLLVGELKGGNDYHRTKAIGEVLQTTVHSLTDLLGFSGAGMRHARAAELVLAAAVLGGVAAFAIHRRGIGVARPMEEVPRRLATLSGVYVLLSTVLLLYLERTTSLGLKARMFLPLMPFAGLLAACLLRHVRFGSSGGKRAALCVLGALVIAFCLGQRRVLVERLHQRNLYAHLLEALAGPTAEGSLGDFLRRGASDAAPLLGNHPQVLAAAVERPVIGLTSRQYTATVWTKDRVAATAGKYHVGYVVVFPQVLEQGEDSEPFFDDLAAGATPAWLEPVLATPSAQVYRVKPADAK